MSASSNRGINYTKKHSFFSTEETELDCAVF